MKSLKELIIEELEKWRLGYSIVASETVADNILILIDNDIKDYMIELEKIRIRCEIELMERNG